MVKSFKNYCSAKSNSAINDAIHIGDCVTSTMGINGDWILGVNPKTNKLCLVEGVFYRSSDEDGDSEDCRSKADAYNGFIQFLVALAIKSVRGGDDDFFKGSLKGMTAGGQLGNTIFEVSVPKTIQDDLKLEKDFDWFFINIKQAEDKTHKLALPAEKVYENASNLYAVLKEVCKTGGNIASIKYKPVSK